LLDFRAERYAEAVESLRKAVNARPGDLERRVNLGKALLRAKRLTQAREEFATALKGAPGQIDALLGAAQVCIELAEEGETEQYLEAERHLSQVLRHSRDGETGSARVAGRRLDNVHYLRGYARTKRWEAEGRAAMPVTLFGALHDFRCCQRHPQSAAARTKILRHLQHRARDSLLAWVASLIIFAAAAFVFTLVQLDFFFQGHPIHHWLNLTEGHKIEPLTYGTLTFGSLLFMVAGLYLERMQKLKVPGIELAKTATDQVSAPSSLGISLPSSPIA